LAVHGGRTTAIECSLITWKVGLAFAAQWASTLEVRIDKLNLS
jgi:hypothetical protein